MFKSLLIANRGEIACRIIRTAKRMGLRTIAVYSEADRFCLHVELADEAYPIGGSPAQESYLNGARILEVAAASGADALHPGYGFLSESAEFAQACNDAGVIFVGPPADAISLMGVKDEAKARMLEAQVPVVPGYSGKQQGNARLVREAEKVGFPLMIKAVAGGGGRGMRLAETAKDLDQALESARREAKAAFGDGRLMLEKYLQPARHIEIQIMADSVGNTVHLFERDCSLQRRHQKIIEEAPAPAMPDGLRERISGAAIRAAEAVGYVGAGTVEFLVAGDRLSDQSEYFFLEMNTRLQVEHPVTEAITGLDLVEWQLRVAAGQSLPETQDRIAMQGHAIEARLYAEDPARGFQPSSSPLHALRWPEGPGLRVDTGFRAGDVITPFYDSLIAKIIAHGQTRAEALERLGKALEQTRVAGPKTNLALLHRLTTRKEIVRGRYDTGLVERRRKALAASSLDPVAIARGIEALLLGRNRSREAGRMRFSDEPRSPWSAADSFALSKAQSRPLRVLVDGKPLDVEVAWNAGNPQVRFEDGAKDGAGRADNGIEIVEVADSVFVLSAMDQAEIRFPDASVSEFDVDGGGGVARSPLPGRVAKIYVSKGQRVASGDRLAVIEAMKMEHVLHAAIEGVIREIAVREGEQVEQGAIVAVVAGQGDE
jgi:3-methylcrotonyl-CoA carboxylase alpha subunit